VSVSHSRGWAVQKRLDVSRSCLGWKHLGTQSTLYSMGSGSSYADGQNRGILPTVKYKSVPCITRSMRPSTNDFRLLLPCKKIANRAKPKICRTIFLAAIAISTTPIWRFKQKCRLYLETSIKFSLQHVTTALCCHQNNQSTHCSSLGSMWQRLTQFIAFLSRQSKIQINVSANSVFVLEKWI